MFILSYLTQIPLLSKGITKRGFDEVLGEIVSNREFLLRGLKRKVQVEMRPQLEKIEHRYGFKIPWQEVEARLDEIDFKAHFKTVCMVMSSWNAAHGLLFTVGSAPCISRQDLAEIKVADKASLHLSTGLMFPPRALPKCAFFFAYIIDVYYSDYDLFQELEEVLPNAKYRAVIPPGPPNSDEAASFFSTPKRCLSNLEGFRDAVKKYLVFDRGFRDESAYSVQVRICKVLLDLEFWMNWKPRRMEIRKHMNQGASLPPHKVIEYLEREEELEVVAIRIPRWLKKKLKDEAASRQEHLGTYLRRKLEMFYK